MKSFELKADIEFKAEDLEHALKQLVDHFHGLIFLNSTFEFEGNLSVKEKEVLEINPNFERELNNFILNQEVLDDPFEEILHEHHWELYGTDKNGNV